MPVERINRYKKTFKLAFCNEQTEQDFAKDQQNRGRSTSIYALSILGIINLIFAFLEHWILGINSSIPLYAYIVVAIIALSGALFSWTNGTTVALKLRILIPGLLTLLVLLTAVSLQQYRIYHGIEMALLVMWVGSLNILSLRFSAILSLGIIAIFTAAAYFFGATGLKLHGLLALLLASYTMALYLSYMLERFRRMMFLTTRALTDVYSRQESWAYTLIDLDMALSGIRDFKELISRMMEYLKSAIDYDSYILTSLEGKGPKPSPDEMDGTLFEQEDSTLWSDDLLTKLSQTRQASTSSQYEVIKGFLGKEKKQFLHFRLDIPVFNDSAMMGVVSLRRKELPFDDLDMTASVSIASQAMMIFNRTNKSSQMSDTLLQQIKDKTQSAGSAQPVTSTAQADEVKAIDQELEKPAMVDVPMDSTEVKVDLDITGNTLANIPQTPAVDDDDTLVPKDVLNKIKMDAESARKTITLLSRENADQIAVDRYRTAAVEGEPLSILLVEVDGLSSIREKDGDQAAYRVFAGIVKHVFSKIDKERDVLGRYGQNGFSILLPRVDMNAAEKFAESLRQFAEGASFRTSYGERSATLSVGVAAITDETGNYDSMVKRADMALFVAKKNGRNCVKVRL